MECDRRGRSDPGHPWEGNDPMRKWIAVATIAAAVLFGRSAPAQDTDELKRQIAELKTLMDKQKTDFEARIADLESQVRENLSDFTKTLDTQIAKVEKFYARPSETGDF